jgi:hypothetical protein
MKKGKTFLVSNIKSKKTSMKNKDKKIANTARTSAEDEGEIIYYKHRNKCVAVRVNKIRK